VNVAQLPTTKVDLPHWRVPLTVFKYGYMVLGGIGSVAWQTRLLNWVTVGTKQAASTIELLNQTL
jgi:hypothetical protein